MAENNSPRTDQDSPWKFILRQYFREAIEFFFSEIAKEIDWTQPIEFLDKEFQQLTPDAELGRRFADQLVKVHRKQNQELILLLHLEVQAAPEKAFAERMFIYSVRIFEYFHQPPVSLAILCDASLSWRPTRYEFSTLGSSLQFDFTAAKLLDYGSQEEWLAQSQNPFAIVVIAHLKTQETKRNLSNRKTWKFLLVKRLYEADYSRSDVLNLFKFLDWIMMLPDSLKREFWQELKAYEEERKMPYITSIEQMGYDRGVKAGEEEGAQRQAKSLVLLLLEQKIGTLPQSLCERINALSLPQLETLAIALLNFSTISDLLTWLDDHDSLIQA